MNHPEPKTLRGKAVWLVLSSLPGLIVVLLMAGTVLLVSQKIAVKQALIAEELKAAAKTEAPAVNVVTLELRPSPLRDKISLPGAVEAWRSLQLMAKVAGSVEEIFVKEGEQVRQGQLIARIESKEYQIAVDSARAASELAKADLARSEALRSKGISTQASLEEQQNQVRQTKAALEDAELKLSRCQITAPMAGVVSRLDAEVGMLVNSFSPAPIAELLELDRVKAVVAVPEADVAAVRGLKQVELEIQALGNEKITAPAHFLAPAPDSQARAYRLELALDNPGRRILPGMFVRASLVKEERAQALAVPLFSVISRNEEQFVYVEEKGLAKRRNVKTGFLEGWQVLITEGLRTGDKVIIEGHRSVEDGQAVKTVKTVSSLDGLLQ
ncbi:efflux RND transporter periplasmic adaptor subunit [Candidatus Electronema sp. TJ]|uniref:efflux RND transporter periplasmic adaptor subunit n=1 Tax=Candidatus Electronema sp. TJ TaxID=3401573 RepID=UPI003AA9C13A